MDNARDIASHLRSRLIADLGMTDGRPAAGGGDDRRAERGEGPPLVLLHGPAEFGAVWMPVLRQLVRSHRVIAPDLPGHGASGLPAGALDAGLVSRWLDALLEQTCPSRPVVVGRVAGGAIAASFAVEHPGRPAHLVLVDSMGLAPFEPTPRFGLALHRYFAGPTVTTFDRLMEFCAFDLDDVRARLCLRGQPYAEYAVELAGTPTTQAAVGGVDRAVRRTDPASAAQGIQDAYRDAELCATALAQAMSGARSCSAAMADYQSARDRQVLPMYELTTQLAGLEPAPPEMERLIRAVAHNGDAMNGFTRMMAGNLSPAEFFGAENVVRIFAAADVHETNARVAPDARRFGETAGTGRGTKN